MQTEQRPARPVPPGPVEQPRLSVAAAARRLGVAPATLRTWDRRYGLGPSEHSPGRHRRYSATDLARLELMQHALVRGASPAEAARYATTARPPVPASAPAAVAPAVPPSAEDGPLPAGHVRVGGLALRLPGAVRRAHGLARAALMLDPLPVRRLLAESVRSIGIEATWDRVVRPVLVALAERWQHTGAGVEIEHQLSECVAVVFGGHAAAASTEAAARPVLLAGMPGELHTLPTVALAAALADRGVPCRALGPNLPVPALVAAVRRTAPAVVVLWAQRPDTADLAVLEALPRTRPRFRTFAAGPGWADRALPPRVGWLDSLAGARSAIVAAVPVRTTGAADRTTRPE